MSPIDNSGLLASERLLLLYSAHLVNVQRALTAGYCKEIRIVYRCYAVDLSLGFYVEE